MATQYDNHKKSENVFIYRDLLLLICTDFWEMNKYREELFSLKGKSLIMVTKGRLDIKDEDKNYVLKQGDLFSINTESLFNKSLASINVEIYILWISTQYHDFINKKVGLDWMERCEIEKNQIFHVEERQSNIIMNYILLLKDLIIVPDSPNKDKSIENLLLSLSYNLSDMTKIES